MKKSFRGLPRILKINEVDSKNLRLSVLFSNGENRILDFKNILNNEWKVESNEPEFLLLQAKEFKKVQLINNTLTWNNIPVFITDNMVGHKLGEFALTRTFKGHPADKKVQKK